MGKRDNRVAYVNPIAAARAKGPVDTGGSTIQDYLNRPGRPTWEEFKEKLDKRNHGSSTLADWEKKMNEQHKEDLRKNREKLLNKALKKKKKEKKMKKKKRHRSPSPSSYSSSSSDSESETQVKKKKKKRKKDSSRSRERYSGSSDERRSSKDRRKRSKLK
ncbi:protein FAM133-like [Anneissia japonica]|uniref:protein FAM133-like n=1 Tax=Anneissia japonica TaxID=1529436 RepID=UPI001425BB89|nr:protein FAM133-like [Anneissia japonica]